MKTEFIALQRARVELLAILERRSRNALDALATAQVFLSDIEQQFIANNGPPHDAEVIAREPDGWWWMYINGVWLGFTSTDGRRGIIFGVVRSVTLVEVKSRPPATAFLPA